MASATDTQTQRDQNTVEVAKSATPEVKVAAEQAVLSEGSIEVSEVLRDRREQTLASAGIKGTFSIPEADGQDEVAVALAEARSDAEFSPEEKWFGEFKTRFDALPKLHKGVQWTDVEKSLKADPESMRKLQSLDEKGHKMNVFGEESGEFVFASGWSDFHEVAADHRNIAYDPDGQKLAEEHRFKPNGNAVSIIAKIMGVKEDEATNYLADPKFHKQLIGVINVNGWTWLKTDAATRKFGFAFYGYDSDIYSRYAIFCHGNGSFRAALRVKKA